MTTTTGKTILNVRGLDEITGAHIRVGAQIRGLTIPEYLTRLVALHQAMRRLEADDDGVHILLREHGLESVQVNG